MEKIIFETETELDLNVIKFMGVSIKGENSIGRFGTGLKFAIATLLRNDCSVELITRGESYKFGIADLSIRDKDFNAVTMNGEPLAFTTSLGRDWLIWMAFRELYSNTLDEGGLVIRTRKELKPIKDKTYIIVSGDNALEAWEEKDHIFLDPSKEPLERVVRLEIFEPLEVGKEKASYIYNRGIRISPEPETMLYSYNILDNVQLSEDRFYKYMFSTLNSISMGVQKLQDKEIIKKIVTAKDTLEDRFDYSNNLITSDAFKEVVTSLFKKHPTSLTIGALTYARSILKDSEIYIEEEMDKYESELLETAKKYISRLKIEGLSDVQIKVVKELGKGILGRADVEKGIAYISKECFPRGINEVTSTLLEELIHVKTGFSDCTRELQTFLFDRLTHISISRLD